MRVWLRESDERGKRLNRYGLRRGEGPFELTIDADSLNLTAQFTDHGLKLTWQAITVMSVGIPLILLVLYFGVDWRYYYDGGIKLESIKYYFYVVGGLLGGYVWLLLSKLANHGEESIKPYREIPLSEIQGISISKRKLQVSTKSLHQQKRFILIHTDQRKAEATHRKLTEFLDAN